jgi:uncharacterized membrane protein
MIFYKHGDESRFRGLQSRLPNIAQCSSTYFQGAAPVVALALTVAFDSGIIKFSWSVKMRKFVTVLLLLCFLSPLPFLLA